MKRGLTTGLLLAFLLPTAKADFSGSYVLTNWLVEGDGAVFGDGVVDTSGNPNSISLTSDNSGFGSEVLFKILIAESGTLNFNWSYSSSDPSGPAQDPFGYKLNADFVQLTLDSFDPGDNLQFGSVSIPVTAGDEFRFVANSLDGGFGAATTTISNFDAPDLPTGIPTPNSVSLLLLGVAGVLFGARRKPWTVHCQ